MDLNMTLIKKHRLHPLANPDKKIEVKIYDDKFEEQNSVIQLSKVMDITEEVGSWRKCNQIHNWFVTHVQCGIDDCGKYVVSYETLMELKDTCLNALADKNPNLLPPAEGFFLGSTEMDDDYWKGIADTLAMLCRLTPDGQYYYMSSW
ncbi:MAG: hypothetical protein EB078_03850 [Proteobacteria bacterium]|nr:hypothetical protein [Pseudomonadota bacterium]NDD04017.1 hypothetical protein [Pseudomonadota bacterium]